MCGHRCDDESGRKEDVRLCLQTFRNNVDDCMTVVDEIVRLTEEVVRGGCGVGDGGGDEEDGDDDGAVGRLTLVQQQQLVSFTLDCLKLLNRIPPSVHFDIFLIFPQKNTVECPILRAR